MEDYITVDANYLGNYASYKSESVNSTKVEFQPDKSTGYYSAVVLNSNMATDESDTEDISENRISHKTSNETPIFSIGKNPVNGFFIGSVTVLGLFILYRLLQKTK
jgi:hypothetical protein